MAKDIVRNSSFASALGERTPEKLVTKALLETQKPEGLASFSGVHSPGAMCRF